MLRRDSYFGNHYLLQFLNDCVKEWKTLVTKLLIPLK